EAEKAGVVGVDDSYISASIDYGIALHLVAQATCRVGARLDGGRIRPSSSGYARAVIVYARCMARGARKNDRPYRVGASSGAGHINCARCRNGGVAAGLHYQGALVGTLPE